MSVEVNKILKEMLEYFYYKGWIVDLIEKEGYSNKDLFIIFFKNREGKKILCPVFREDVIFCSEGEYDFYKFFIDERVKKNWMTEDVNKKLKGIKKELRQWL